MSSCNGRRMMVQRQGYFPAHFLETPFKNSLVLLPGSSSDFPPLPSHARCEDQSKVSVFELSSLTVLVSCNDHENDSAHAL